jgi:putative ABC transport system substrate-binding protein
VRINVPPASEGAAAAWPLAARAQQGERVRRIGVPIPGEENDPVSKTWVSAFTQALAGLGWTDGRNVRMDLRWSPLDIDRMHALAQELVGLQPDIIVTIGATVTVYQWGLLTRVDDPEREPVKVRRALDQ